MRLQNHRCWRLDDFVSACRDEEKTRIIDWDSESSTYGPWICYSIEMVSHIFWCNTVSTGCIRNALLTYLITPCSRILLEKLTGSQLVKKFHAFYETQRFITALTSARYLSISWARSVQSIPTQPTSWICIVILSSHLRLGFTSGLFPSGLSTQNPACISPVTHTWYMPRLSNSSRFGHPKSMRWAVHVIKLLIM